jgi:hypothetical protein
MTRQWIREVKLQVAGGSTITDLSALRIRFQTMQNNLQRPNSAHITITNPSPDTAKRLQKEGTVVRLEAGYQDGGPALIYQGNLIQKRVGRENPVETYLDMLAGDGDQAYNFATVSKTLSAGSTFRDQVDVVAQSMKEYGVEIGYIPDLGDKKMPRARSLFGMARDIMRDIAFSTGCSWSIQDGKLTMVKNQESLPGDVHVINSNTGMVGLPEQTLDGIKVRMLLNPKIKPGSRLKIDQASVQTALFSPNYTAEVQNSMIPSLADDGVYKCLVVEHQGDTRGLSYYTNVTCIRADGQGPLPIGLAGQGINLDPGEQ